MKFELAGSRLLITVLGLIAFRWILGEDHSPYGDEASHLEFTHEAIARLLGIREQGAGAFLISFRYPPLFYYLASPFVLLSAVPLLGARIFVFMVSAASAYILYRSLCLIAAPFEAICGVLVFVSSGWFLETSRFYLAEGVLGFWLIALLWFTLLYFQTSDRKYLLWIGCLHAAGLMTKFNFAFYSVWVLGPLGLKILLEGHSANWRTDTPIRLLWLCAPTLVLALPWYLLHVGSLRSTAGGLSELVRSGNLRAAASLSQALGFSLSAFTRLYPIAILITLLLMGVVLIAARMGRFWTSSLRYPSLIAGIVLGVLVIPIWLSYIGLGNQGRWHLEFIFVPILIGVGLTQLPTCFRYPAGSFCAAIALLAIANSYFAPLPFSRWISFPAAEFLGRPNRVPIGMRDAASDIIRFDRSEHSDQPRQVFFAFHEHRGAHYASLNTYLGQRDTRIRASVGAFFDRPLDLSNILESGFVALSEPLVDSRTNDRELMRYQQLLQVAPKEYWQGLRLVSDVDGRFGRFKVFSVPPSIITSDTVDKLISQGKVLDGDRSNLFWDEQELYWSLRLGRLDGSVARARHKELLARYQATELDTSPSHKAQFMALANRIDALLAAGRPR